MLLCPPLRPQQKIPTLSRCYNTLLLQLVVSSNICPSLTINPSVQVFVEILTNEAGDTPDTFMDQLSCPIHFVWGDQDPFTPLDGPYGQYFSELSRQPESGVSLSVVRGGHCPHDDYHEEANEEALRWLRQFL